MLAEKGKNLVSFLLKIRDRRNEVFPTGKDGSLQGIRDHSRPIESCSPPHEPKRSSLSLNLTTPIGDAAFKGPADDEEAGIIIFILSVI